MTFRSAAGVAGLLMGVSVALLPARGFAQAANQPGWFVPKGGSAAAPGAQPAPARPMPRPLPTPELDTAAEQADVAPPANMPMPPMPDIPAVPTSPPPPAAVIGVIGVPEVMRASTAAQAVEKAINERREKLNSDAQKEQAVWRDLQQSLLNQRATLTPEQGRAKERELQDRVNAAQKKFRERNAVIQQAAQYSLSQIERVLVQIVQRVAAARGINLVLHRTQVAMNANEFDITLQVTGELNKILPAVVIPPDGMTMAEFAKQMQAAAPAPAAPTGVSATSAPAAKPAVPAPGPRRQ